MARSKKTESVSVTWSDIRVASDEFINNAHKTAPKGAGLNAEALEELLNACRASEVRAATPIWAGRKRSAQGLPPKKENGSWSHHAVLTTWAQYKRDTCEKAGYEPPNVYSVPWDLVPAAQKARLRIESKFPKVGFTPSYLLVLYSTPEDKEIFVAPKVAIAGTYTSSEGYSPKEKDAKGVERIVPVMLTKAIVVDRDRYVRGTLQMAKPAITRTKVTAEVAVDGPISQDDLSFDFS